MSQIYVDTGRREVNWNLINVTKAEIAGYPAWKRLYYFLFRGPWDKTERQGRGCGVGGG